MAAIEPLVSPRPYAAADLAFGLSVLDTWCAQDSTANIVLSPSSLSSALGMAYLGARGSTATAMAGVLHLPASGSLEAGLQARARALRGLDGAGVTVADADQVWADPALPPLGSYVDALATSYGAGLRQAPLLTDPAAAAKQINAAIAAATKGHISRLLSAQGLQNVVFVLTDALYLKARWATPFQPGSTTTGQFAVSAGRPVQAHFLNGDETAAAYAGWTAVSLPYQGGRLSMTALLPPLGSAGCAGLTTADVAAIAGRLGKPADSAVANVFLPEINLSSQANLDGLLGQLGMSIAFNPQEANFTGLSPQAGYIGSVVQGATLRVDAQGTVASAATAVTILPSMAVAPKAPPIVFNRPYLLLVTATATGEPLFLARVANPDLA